MKNALWILLILLGICVFGFTSCKREKVERVNMSQEEYDGVLDALKYYRDYKTEVLAGGPTREKYVKFLDKRGIFNGSMYLHFFKVISEIEDSSKVASGRKYVEKKYPASIRNAVKFELGL